MKQDLQSKTEGDTRLEIGFIFLIFFLSLLLISILFFQPLVYYKLTDYENGWKIGGRIFFVFIFFVLGLSMRAFKFYSIGRAQKLEKSNPWQVYGVEYPLTGVVVSVFIFSVVTAIESLTSTPLFYLLSSSVAIGAGFRGYASLIDMKVG